MNGTLWKNARTWIGRMRRPRRKKLWCWARAGRRSNFSKPLVRDVCSQSFCFFFFFRTCVRLSYCHRGLLLFLMSYHSWLLQSCSSAIESQYHTSRATIGIDLLFSMSRSCRMLVTLFVDSPKKRREHNIVVPIQSNRLTYWTLFFFAIFCLFFVNVARL